MQTAKTKNYTNPRKKCHFLAVLLFKNFLTPCTVSLRPVHAVRTKLPIFTGVNKSIIMRRSKSNAHIPNGVLEIMAFRIKFRSCTV
jgi:hypothetical protein